MMRIFSKHICTLAHIEQGEIILARSDIANYLSAQSIDSSLGSRINGKHFSNIASAAMISGIPTRISLHYVC
jgi:hypothetical protein